jgi:putative ABC transport system ATP-binding protein
MSDTMTMLELANVTKTFNPGTVNEKVAMNKLSLSVKKGDFITVIGGNGAGKSTLMNAVTGVFGIDSGKITLDGIDITGFAEHKRAKFFGRVFQDPMMGTVPDMEIQENLALAYRRGKNHGLGWGINAKEKALYKEQLSRLGLGLENRMSAKVGLLSGGQRQALTLLMSTLVRPKMLLLDEHTAALDPKTAEKVLQLTNEIVSEDSLTTLMVTHNMQNAIDYGNRLIMMWDGKVILDIGGEEKKNLTVEALLNAFSKASGSAFTNDRALLS